VSDETGDTLESVETQVLEPLDPDPRGRETDVESVPAIQPAQAGSENQAVTAEQANPLFAPTPVFSGWPSYVYALGRIEPRFPSLAVEKEFAQVAGRAETANLTDHQAVQALLAERENRYLARQLCWVLTTEGLETYILQPSDPQDVDRLLDALRPTPRLTDVDIVIGTLGPIAPPEVLQQSHGAHRGFRPGVFV
jgi:hypothetical protein